MEDAELIGRARTGDVQAYEALVRRYQDVAMRTAYLVAPEADAADAVQDAFVKAYAALSRFRDGAPLRRGCCASSPTRRATGGVRPTDGPGWRSARPSGEPRDERRPLPEAASSPPRRSAELLAALGRCATRTAR